MIDLDFSSMRSLRSGWTEENFSCTLALLLESLGILMNREEVFGVDFQVGRLISESRQVRFRFSNKFRPVAAITPTVHRIPELILPSSIPANRSLSETCRDMVYRDALSRHVSDMEARATEALHAKKLWTEKIMTDQLRYELDTNRKRNKSRENARYLLRQMQMNEQKRKSDKMKEIVDGSCHDFPGINDHPPCDREAAIRARRELDSQLQTERRLRTILRTRDLDLARKFQEENRRELARLDAERTLKKLNHKYILNEAWNRDLRIKNCWKSIETFDSDNMHESISFARPHTSR